MSNFSKGVDVSLWNDVTNWSAAKASGLEWVSIKFSEADFMDPKAISSVSGARAAGIPIMPYHYLRSDYDASEQYSVFHDAIEHCGGWGGLLVPALDVEGDVGNNITCSSAAYLDKAEKWCSLLKSEIGRDAVIYTYPSFNSEHGVGSRLGDHPLWAASYRAGSPVSFSGWSTWTFWQYSDHGSMPGLGGGLDMDYYNGTESDLVAKFSVKALLEPKVVGPDSKVILCEPKIEADGRMTVKGAPLLSALGLPQPDPAVHADSGRAYLKDLEHAPWVFYYRNTDQGVRVYIKKKA